MPFRDKLHGLKSRAKARINIIRTPSATHSSTSIPESTNNWAGLKSFLGVVDQAAGAFGPLKLVVSELVECVRIYESVANGREEYEALQKELEGLFTELRRHFAQTTLPTVTTSMENLCKSIQQELDYVQGKQTRDARRRHIEAGEGPDEVLRCYRRIQGYLQCLSLNANLSVWKGVDELATDNRLKELSPSLSACFDSSKAVELKRGPCTPGTRIDVLAQLYNWVLTLEAGSIYWMSGMAGTGKTTIAYSLCVELDTNHKLAASFFCSRLLPECRDVNRIIPSIAYQLARFSQPFRYALSQVLEKEPDVHTRLPSIQFDALIAKPLIEVRETLPANLVVVIEALDECENKGGTGQMLDILLAKASDLPIKFFVSSRPEPVIRDQMTKQSDQIGPRVVLHELEKGVVQADIKRYLIAALAPMNPSESQIAALVERAGILFIYAATAVRYISYDNFHRNPRARLETVLNALSSAENNKNKEIDELYTTILKAALDDPGLDKAEKGDMKQVLYTVICAQEPLTIRALSGLLKLHDIDRVHAALRPLWSVLHVVGTSELVTTLHASFPDYMLDSTRSKAYWCDQSAHHYVLTQLCFDCIKDTKPQFNICGLESSYVPDGEVTDLAQRVQNAISTKLFYACRYWAAHLHFTESSDLSKWLEDFLSVRLLLWVEVMNLKKSMHTATMMIHLAEDWSIRQACTKELIDLARDAWRFTTTFALNSVSQSTPHLYMTMLPFWPRSSPIAQHYVKRTQRMVEIEGTAMSLSQLALLAKWSFKRSTNSATFSPDGTRIVLGAGKIVCLLDAFSGRRLLESLQGHIKPVTSVGFSPDGSRIVSGSCDKTIRLWDAQSGKMLLGPLKGHTHSVTSVGFSPDGTRIVSSSYDRTICVWDAQSGRMVLGPLKGHTGSITSVRFSPDGTRIVSGSYDKTIRLWDAQNGQVIVGPFKGCNWSVISLGFSFDGARIVSGSYEKSIHLWDARSGEMILGPLEGHTESVISVAFSSDGTCIVSGSADRSICVWDARNGRIMLGPLKEHTDRVTSVGFSSDDARIVSASLDNTICVWDARSRQIVLDSSKGHTNSITAVGFSPDGTRIVSSSDKTICIWDAQSGQMVLGPLKEHTHSVTSVMFSPDGTRVVSGSADKTICVWDAQSGQMALGPLTGHTLSVRSVGFSPDGTRIVSGSNDRAIYLWDAENGEVVLGPLKGHTDSITSVGLSSDGNRIVSGSEDNTICVWDARSSRMVLGPLRGHTNWVTSVGFSPDGSRILSSSLDYTIRVWDARKGHMVLGPLEGHTRPVISVGFSPNGTRIASGSDDNTIYVWDAQNGEVVLGALQGHTSWITSVGFSPDGTRIVSGSNDKTIRVFDTQSVETLSQFRNPTLPASTEWEMNEEGWVVDKQSRLLIWVPADLRDALMWPRTTLLISTDGYLRLNFNNACIGEWWTECYQPA